MRTLVLALALILTSLAHAQGDGEGPDTYDVVVVGSEPEAIAAAVAAAEEGARTLLVSEDERLGGLFVLGELNVLDLRTQPVNFQGGLFDRWWRLVGRGHSFDVRRAEQAFADLLEVANVEVMLGSPPPSPVVERGSLVGVRAGEGVFAARQIVDGTADGDFAAAAGAHFTVGFESLGLAERMVDTLVFRIEGVDWGRLRSGILERGRSYATIDDRVAWGHFGGYPAAYEPLEEGLRLRGLNLGLQDDGSVLVNALLIHGIDPFDPASRAEGRGRALREAPRVVDYLARELPGFAGARFAGAAERLYIRESRHFDTLCRVTANDVLDNRVEPLDVAAGGYPLDVQVLTPFDSGYVFGAPEIYGVPLCVAVPLEPAGLWIVGKTAGYDPIAASSARVVPLGMNVAEAVGVAAALAARDEIAPTRVAGSEVHLTELRTILRERRAYLPPVEERTPVGPHTHPHYRAFRLMLSRGLAVGGYDNDPRLDTPASAVSHLYLLSNVLARFFALPEAGTQIVEQVGVPEGPLTPERAAELTRLAACLAGDCTWGEAAWRGVQAAGIQGLTRGHSYELAASLVRAAVAQGALPDPVVGR